MTPTNTRRALLGIFLVLLATAPLPAVARVVDGVAAVVNEDVILVSEINEAMQPVIREYTQRYTGEELRQKLRELQEAVISKAIEDKLILQVAKQHGIKAEKGQIDERMDAVIERFGSIEEFERQVEARGLTPREYREQVRDQILVQETIRQVVGTKIRITDNDIVEYYREHRDEFELAPARRLGSIFLGYPEDVPVSQRGLVRRRAEQIQLLAADGAQFGELARKFSEGPHRQKSGDVGFVSHGEILPALEDAAFAATVGAAPVIVETPAGVHLLVVTDERPGRLIPLSEARARIQATLTEEEQNERYEKWIDALKDQSFIDRKL